MSMIDHDDIDQLNAQARARVEDGPRVTRRRDGKVFHIISQARSPDGPVELASVGLHSLERITVNGRDFARDFIDPRKGHAELPAQSIPTPQEIRAKREAAKAARVESLVRTIVRQFTDDTAETVTEPAPFDVAEGAASLLRGYGWRCEVKHPDGQTDATITVQLAEPSHD